MKEKNARFVFHKFGQSKKGAPATGAPFMSSLVKVFYLRGFGLCLFPLTLLGQRRSQAKQGFAVFGRDNLNQTDKFSQNKVALLVLWYEKIPNIDAQRLGDGLKAPKVHAFFASLDLR